VLGIPDNVMPHVRRFGFSGVVAVAVVVVMLLGINPVTILTGQHAEPLPHTTLTALEAIANGEAEPEALVDAVSREANGFWERGFRQASVSYPPVQLVKVADAREFGCGMAGSRMGVFYCPENSTIYVDMSAYAALLEAFPQEGHKAEGYLIGRAYGHHVQQALAEWGSQPLPQPGDTELERRLSAQAACYAGVWTKWAGLEPLLDDPAMVEAIQSVDVGQDIAALPSRAGQRLPDSYARADAAMLRQWFNAGYAIPAGGSCKLEKIPAAG
jgi:uncharacterized protein